MPCCVKCEASKSTHDFYASDSTCKECRKKCIRANRAAKIEYYRQYDRMRNMRPDRIAARKSYAESELGKTIINRIKYRWGSRNPIKQRCSNAVNNAVRDGRLTKPSHCSGCGATGRIHGHHDNYARPLDVRWLCSTCHKAWHHKHGEGLNANSEEAA